MSHLSLLKSKVYVHNKIRLSKNHENNSRCMLSGFLNPKFTNASVSFRDFKTATLSNVYNSISLKHRFLLGKIRLIRSNLSNGMQLLLKNILLVFYWLNDTILVPTERV